MVTMNHEKQRRFSLRKLLSETPWTQRLLDAIPFSMSCDGQEVEDWSQQFDSENVWTFRSDSKGLEVELHAHACAGGRGTEVRVLLKNHGVHASGLLSNIAFLRFRVAIGLDDVPVIHHCGGGQSDATFPGPAWRVQRTELPDWSALHLEGAKGRSSNKDLPLFLLTDDQERDGCAIAMGYSGHVLTTFLRDFDYRSVQVTSRVKNLKLRLAAGESIALGSWLLLPYEGDEMSGKNALRRVLREEICPRLPSRSGMPAVTYVHWFGIEENYDHQSLLREANLQAALGAEYFELDAAWAMQGTEQHYGAGNWEIENSRKFPAGIGAFADEVRALGLRFGMWMEPERVEPGTKMDRDMNHLLLRCPGQSLALLDFSKPEAVERITQIVCDVIERNGVEWMRLDSNLDPDAYWATIPDEGLRGLTQLRHFEGFYRMVDEMRRRFPNLHIEGCSSGGRRIDLETLRRSHSLWISDDPMYQATVHKNIGGANHFLPAHLINSQAAKYPIFFQKVRSPSQCGRDVFSDFWLMSLMGGLFGLGGPHTAYPPETNERFRALVKKYLEIRPNLAGDFYPLLPQPGSVNDWDAWQFHDPAGQRGHVVVFRMKGVQRACSIPFRALDPKRTYELCVHGGSSAWHVSGADLISKGLACSLPDHWSAQLATYYAL